MRTQSFSLLWLVAACVMSTVLCKTVELSEFNSDININDNSGVARPEEENPLLDQNGPEETAEPSEHGGVEAKLSSLAEASVPEEKSDWAKTAYIDSEDDTEREHRFSRKLIKLLRVISVPCHQCSHHNCKMAGSFTCNQFSIKFKITQGLVQVI